MTTTHLADLVTAHDVRGLTGPLLDPPSVTPLAQAIADPGSAHRLVTSTARGRA